VSIFLPEYTSISQGLTIRILVGIYRIARLPPYIGNYRWYPKRVLGGIFSIWLVTIMLTMLLCIKILQLVDARGSTFSQRLDILRDRGADAAGQHRLKKIGKRASDSWWGYPVHVLFGRKIWERRLR
jgi:hypothetical protein